MLAIAAIGLLGACTSQPGPKTVARDYVDGMLSADPPEITQAEHDCLIDKLNAYSDAELEAIGEGNVDVAFAGATEVPAGATPEFEAYVADLGECFDEA